MKIAIQNKTVEGQIANAIDIQINAVRLNDSAEIHVDFMKENGTIQINGQTVPNIERITQKQFVIAGAEYQAWNNDQYIIDYVLNKYGLVVV
jgi:hypothetical protein